ncbi:MAG: oligosaccharide flippase family protein, partial [Aquificaceae bacterium]
MEHGIKGKAFKRLLENILIKLLGEEFKSAIFHLKPIILLTIAHALSSLVGFLITLLSARKLEVHTFGLFSLAYATITWIAVVGDFGVGASMIRLYNKYKEDKEKQRAIISSAFLWELVIFLLIALTSPLLTYLLLKTLGLNPEEAFYLFLISFLSGGLFILWNYLQAYLQAKERFTTYSLYVFIYSLLRVLLLFFVYFVYSQSPVAWLLISYAIPLLPLLFFFLFKNTSLISLSFQSLVYTKEILAYSKWVAMSSIAGSSILYVSRFILAKVSSLEEVGIFSAGVNLAFGLSVLYNGLYFFLYPKITAFEKDQISKYL